MKEYNELDKSNKVYKINKANIDYYTIPNFVAVGRVNSKEKWNCGEHRHTSYECIYIKKGRVKYWCNNQEFMVKTGDFYFIQPGQKHKEVGYDEPLEFIYLKFKYNSLKGKTYYIVPQCSDPKLQVIRNIDKDIVALMGKVYLELQNKQLGTKQIVEAIILQLIWFIIRKLNLVKQTDEGEFGYKNTLVEKAINYIKVNKYNKIAIKQIAEHCNVSSDYLSHIFKEVTDFTPLQYVDHIKMDEAIKMVLFKEMNIGEIAYKLGYTDSLYFSKKFKRIFGVSPTNYKKQYNKNKQNKP